MADSNILTEKCTRLKGNWGVRDQKIRDWYNILTLKDELKQESMESVVSNDPLTGYKLGKHLMTSSVVADKIDVEKLKPEEIQSTSYLEGYVTTRWLNEERRYRKMGRQSFKGELLGLMLATGWYAVFSMVTEDAIFSEVWNPIEVYPEFGSDGLVEVAHIYSLSATQANRKAKMMGWAIKIPFTGNVTVYDYWGFDDNGDVVNGILMGSEYVKELQVDSNLSALNNKVGQLPIFTGPVGGLPDRGPIVGGDWQKTVGQSIVATNEELAKNYNKMLSFNQQAARNAAQPRWFEKSTGDSPLLTEEKLNTWGAIFRGGPNDDIGPLQATPIPIELRTMMFEYGNMLQRGLFPAGIFGNVQQQMSYLAMANIASSALQVLTPYMDAYIGLRSDIDNFWFAMLQVNKLKPYNFEMPKTLPESFDFEVQADIDLPGFMVQKATVARMLDPTFKLPTRVVMDKLFPEIRNPLKAMAEARKDAAMMNPKAILVDQIIAYKEQAALYQEAGDTEAGRLYEKLAASMEAELTAPAQPQPARQASPIEQAMTEEVTGQPPQPGVGG